jgi:hypothetical protein
MKAIMSIEERDAQFAEDAGMYFFMSYYQTLLDILSRASNMMSGTIDFTSAL